VENHIFVLFHCRLVVLEGRGREGLLFKVLEPYFFRHLLDSIEHGARTRVNLVELVLNRHREDHLTKALLCVFRLSWVQEDPFEARALLYVLRLAVASPIIFASIVQREKALLLLIPVRGVATVLSYVAFRSVLLLQDCDGLHARSLVRDRLGRRLLPW
jgi:hypothetical protein